MIPSRNVDTPGNEKIPYDRLCDNEKQPACPVYRCPGDERRKLLDRPSDD